MSTNDDLYIGWSSAVAYRGLETPHLFHIVNDELYELDDEGLAFLDEIDGRCRVQDIRNRDLLAFCEEEGLVAYHPEPSPIDLKIGKSPDPSLRYLELQLTARCNLKCKHCYLGPASNMDMHLDTALDILDQFDSMQGLRVLLSGGEPLLYPQFDKLNEHLTGYGFRVVLLTNGVLMDEDTAVNLNAHEVQVSIDGMGPGHDLLRGNGSFDKVVSAAKAVTAAGLDLSIATMAHSGNLDQMEQLKQLIEDLGAREWSIDVPCITGRLEESSELAVTPEQGAQAMSLGFGGSYHGSGEGFACGRHLATVMPGGSVCQCGFYADQPLGNVSEGLEVCWLRREYIRLTDLECGDCKALEECAGGCRFRAGGPAKDPVMCALFQNEL